MTRRPDVLTKNPDHARGTENEKTTIQTYSRALMNVRYRRKADMEPGIQVLTLDNSPAIISPF